MQTTTESFYTSIFSFLENTYVQCTPFASTPTENLPPRYLRIETIEPLCEFVSLVAI